MTYQVEKYYPHSLGWSACFRQPGANSHCRWLHGYPLAFRFRFEADDLDHRNWVIDFGSLKNLKQWLEMSFDHRLIASIDDPKLHLLRQLHEADMANLLVLRRVGVESFAEYAGHFARDYVKNAVGERVRLLWVECREHEGNGGFWINDAASPQRRISPASGG